MKCNKTCLVLVIISWLIITAVFSGATPPEQAADLTQAITHLAQGQPEKAVEILERLKQGTDDELVYFYLGNAYAKQQKSDKAIATYEEGVAKFPLSARLQNALAVAYEQQFELAKALTAYRQAIALDPVLVNTGGGRYDAEFNAIYIPVVHDHRGANSCSGRLYIDDQKLHYVAYIVVSGLGRGNDDSFESPLSNLEQVEVDRKKGELSSDYSVITLLTNLSGARRRPAAEDESRVDLKLVFKQPVKGYRGNPWSKSEIKLFFVEPEIGDRYLKFLESKKIKIK